MSPDQRDRRWFGPGLLSSLPAIGTIVMRTIVSAALSVTVTTSSARAVDCGTEATQMGMNECAHRESGAADLALDDLLDAIKARLTEWRERRELLVAAQRSWTLFRDAECAFTASGVQGGSVQPMIYSMCLTRLTMARIDDLRRFAACQEGDMACPVPVK